MVRIDLVRAKVRRLRETVAGLRACLPADAQGLSLGRDILDLVSFRVYLGVQEAIDLAAHLAADQGWGPLPTLREHFGLLATKGVLDPVLAGDLGAAVKVRNLIGHAYAEVDPIKLYPAASKLVGLLESFCAAVLAFAEANAS
jgi:uncharacterized protein YutE (UPF0331/DUF86 family)